MVKKFHGVPFIDLCFQMNRKKEGTLQLYIPLHENTHHDETNAKHHRKIIYMFFFPFVSSCSASLSVPHFFPVSLLRFPYFSYSSLCPLHAAENLYLLIKSPYISKHSITHGQQQLQPCLKSQSFCTSSADLSFIRLDRQTVLEAV